MLDIFILSANCCSQDCLMGLLLTADISSHNVWARGELEQGSWVLRLASENSTFGRNGWLIRLFFKGQIPVYPSSIIFKIRKWRVELEIIQRADEIIAANWMYSCARFILPRIDHAERPTSEWFRIHRNAGLFLFLKFQKEKSEMLAFYSVLWYQASCFTFLLLRELKCYY